MRFSFSNAAQVDVRRQGRESELVILVSEAATNAPGLVDLASSLAYGRIGPHFPGVRAAAGADFNQSVIDAAGALIDAQTGAPARSWRGECYFSMVATPPGALSPIQRFPHFDGVEEDRYAALLFLCGGEFGGTSFYRHKATGFETVGADRFDRFKATLEAEVRRSGLPPPAYIGDGSPFFEEIAGYDATMNRMLIYRGKALHCSRIARPDLLAVDSRRGRLSLNLFLTPRSLPQ